MATVTNNMTRINDCEGVISTENIPKGGQNATENTDIYLQGSQSYARRTTDTGATPKGFAIIDAADNDCSASGTHIGMWIWCTHYSILQVLRATIGTGASNVANNYDYWDITISTYPNTGGWMRVWVDPTTGTTGAGTYTTSQTRHIGIGASFTQTPGGNAQNLVIDSHDYVAGAALTLTGTSGAWSDFRDDATNGDEITGNQWGVIRSIGGADNVYARVQLGTSASSLVFDDSNFSISFVDQEFVASDFMGINVNLENTSTDIAWTNGVITSAGTKQGDLVVTGTTSTAGFTATGCTLSGLRVITLTSKCTINGGLIAGSGLITQSSATISGATISNSTNAIAMSVDDISKVTGNTFVGDGTTTPGHAVDLGTLTTQTITWDNILDNGTTNAAEWEGSTQAATAGPQGDANAAIKVNVPSGNTLTISVAAGATTPTVYNTGTGSLAITAGQVTLTLTDIVADSAANIAGGAESSEVRIYSHGTTTELDGIEDVVEDSPGTKIGSFDYTYTYSAGTYVDIVVHHVDYQYYRIENVLLGSGDASIPIQQIYDRNYNNPV